MISFVILYNSGIRKIVKNVPTDNPPIIAIAKGFWLCAPIPFDNDAGNNHKIATSDAVKTGLNFWIAPFSIAEIRFVFNLFCLMIEESNITPF